MAISWRHQEQPEELEICPGPSPSLFIGNLAHLAAHYVKHPSLQAYKPRAPPIFAHDDKDLADASSYLKLVHFISSFYSMSMMITSHGDGVHALRVCASRLKG